jgi:hypothetical protein
MRTLAPGDVVTVTKLDRLARSSRDLHNILHELAERGCGFVSLGEAWCDTTTTPRTTPLEKSNCPMENPVKKLLTCGAQLQLPQYLARNFRRTSVIGDRFAISEY